MERIALRRLLGAAAAVLLAVAGATLVGKAPRAPVAPSPRAPAERPTLLLLTALPLVFGERFALGGGSPALAGLEQRYRVVPIAFADERALSGGSLLLAAQPRAQPAEALVALDHWVRRGGRLLLLADPALEWHSERPLGDLLGPPTAYPDTGLIGHWGLRLDLPAERGPIERQVDGWRLRLASPGSLSGKCRLAGEGLVARCAIGRGRATIIADADLLDLGGLDGAAEADNLGWLLAELARIERPAAAASKRDQQAYPQVDAQERK